MQLGCTGGLCVLLSFHLLQELIIDLVVCNLIHIEWTCGTLPLHSWYLPRHQRDLPFGLSQVPTECSLVQSTDTGEEGDLYRRFGAPAVEC